MEHQPRGIVSHACLTGFWRRFVFVCQQIGCFEDFTIPPSTKFALNLIIILVAEFYRRVFVVRVQFVASLILDLRDSVGIHLWQILGINLH